MPETFDIGGTIGDASVTVVCEEGEREVAAAGFLEGPVWVNIQWREVGLDREATFDLLAEMARAMQAQAAAMSTAAAATEATNPG